MTEATSPSNSATGAQADDAGSAKDALLALEAKINAILPPRYVGCFEDVPASSMGSASLKYDKDGKVAWGSIWTTFCHLALAGGPPHRGRFLDAVPVTEVLAHPVEQAAVVGEIKRAIGLCAEFPTIDEDRPGWIGIRCADTDMAAWMVRAIVAENVIARHEENLLFVPAGPGFRIEKEVKNVVVCVAKSFHYLLDHIDAENRPRGFSQNLIQPPLPEEIAADLPRYQAAAGELRDALIECLGLKAFVSDPPGWVSMECASEEMAIWLQRAIIVENILARREAVTLFVPVPLGDSATEAQATIVRVVGEVLRLWQLRTTA